MTGTTSFLEPHSFKTLYILIHELGYNIMCLEITKDDFQYILFDSFQEGTKDSSLNVVQGFDITHYVQKNSQIQNTQQVATDISTLLLNNFSLEIRFSKTCKFITYAKV